MSNRTLSLISGALLTVALVMMVSGVFLVYLQFAKYDPPYLVVNPQGHYATMLDAETIAVGREFHVTRATAFTITGEITRRHDDVLVRVEMPTTHVDYAPGKHNIQRIYDMPKLEAGEYALYNRICWSANILRRDCIELPVLAVKILQE